MTAAVEILGRRIGPGKPPYVIAELSANHNGSYEEAEKLLRAAKACGADAIKLQTYTADTITLDSKKEYFMIRGTAWDGRNLHELYREAYTPWDWQPKLKAVADELGIHLFSSPFDETAVDFLEKMNVPAYKIASFEIVDLPLLRKVAATQKPVIVSTGMATLEEIEEAMKTLRGGGAEEIILLKCTSTYPAKPEDMHLRGIEVLSERFGVPAGLSDHTLGSTIPTAAVARGACVIEKHFTLSREIQGPDSHFSMEPEEFRSMVQAVRDAFESLGEARFDAGSQEGTRRLRPSLFVVKDMKAGEGFTPENVKSIRPGHGLHTRHFEEILGKKAAQAIERGTPLSWELIQ